MKRLKKIIRFIKTLILGEKGHYGLLAEFGDPGQLLEAARAVRNKGYRRFDVHSPFPIHGMDDAMRLGYPLLPWLVFFGGLTGGLGGLALQCWVSAVDYPLVIDGKPFLSIPAFMPIVFELTVLLAALSAVFGMIFFNLLPMLYHPLFKVERFSHATQDAFFLSIQARDKRFDIEATRQLLQSLGGQNITLVEK